MQVTLTASAADTESEAADGTDAADQSLVVTKTCVSCDEGLPTAEFASFAPGAACSHGNDTCTDCWQQWLETQLASTSAFNITCAQCSNTLHQTDVQLLATPEVFERYLDTCLRLCMADDPNFRWCALGSCPSGQVHDGLQGNIFTCVECGHKSCVDCNTEWHSGQSCEEIQEEKAALRQWEYLKEVDAQRRRGSISDKAAAILVNRDAGEVSATVGRLVVEEAESSDTVEKHSKQCPSCRSRIQKIAYVNIQYSLTKHG